MVTVDLKKGIAILQPSQPNKNSVTITITIPKEFANVLNIDKHSNLEMRLRGDCLVIKKVKI